MAEDLSTDTYFPTSYSGTLTTNGTANKVSTISLHAQTRYVGVLAHTNDLKVENHDHGTADGDTIGARFGTVKADGWQVFYWPRASLNIACASTSSSYEIAQYSERPA